jgi:hypothetical protein
MVYKNVKEVYTDEDFGIITIITDKEVITIDIKTYTNLKFETKREKRKDI